MKISEGERLAIQTVIELGSLYGYGNMIAHLQTAWARRLMVGDFKVSEASARMESGGPGYPFKMQDDLIERGEWDETGESYR